MRRLFPLTATLLLAGGLVATSLVGTATASGVTALNVAEAPGAAPSDIFPLTNCQYDTTNNVQTFQQLMFRPLYWYGLGASVAEQPALSLANAPIFNRASTQATITMKGWRFANGQPVNATAVLFYLNLWRANPSDVCNDTPGHDLTAVLRNATASGNTVTLTFATPVNPAWLLGNILSNVTPLPTTWDRSAAAANAGCATGRYALASTDASCVAVAAYLTTLGTTSTSFASAFWQAGTDGPWKLSRFDANGNATFVANPTYGGPQRPRVQQLNLVAFNSLAAEESALENNTLSFGYVDPSQVGATTRAPGVAGANWSAVAAHYNLSASTTWGFNDVIINFANTGAEQPVLAQGYVRQALQMSIDQSSMITSALRGYGVSADSPLPAATPASLGVVKKDPTSYNLAAAMSLLSSHGWSLTGTTLTCTNAGTSSTQCGDGVAAGTPLSLSLVAASGDPVVLAEVRILTADWTNLGVALNVTYDTPARTAGDCTAATAVQLCLTGQGWDYLNDAYPSGEALFGVGPATNLGGYNDPTMSSLINATQSQKVTLSAYATFAATQVPVLYLPSSEQLIEVNRIVTSKIGLAPNPLGSFTPEYDGLL